MTSTEEALKGRSALVMGATGLVGRHCLDLLLADEAYATVHVVGRRSLERTDPKLVEHVIDLTTLEEHAGLFGVNDVFCCLGTTIRKAGSQEAFLQVDVEYPATAARLATDAGADQFLVVSALGADAQSRIFYNRAKGEMEAKVRRMPLQAVWVVRPALLLGDRAETRIGERVAEWLLRPFGPMMVGRLRRYRPVHARQVASAMVSLAKENGTGGIVESEEIAALATL